MPSSSTLVFVKLCPTPPYSSTRQSATPDAAQLVLETAPLLGGEERVFGPGAEKEARADRTSGVEIGGRLPGVERDHGLQVRAGCASSIAITPPKQ